ncbi:MAG: peptide transporter permease [Ilumatobacteraceae bacterium]|nr:peptide transporter permease [Ilumatobacteraceae bacterium]
MALPLQAEERSGIGSADPTIEPPEHTILPRPRRRRRRLPYISGSILTLFVLTGLFGPFLAPYDPETLQLGASLQPPVFASGTRAHLLGTDQLGRDELSRLIYGARISLLVALAVVLLAGVVGVTVAVVAGYKGGRLDAFLMRTTDASMAFPVLLLAIVIVGVFGPSTTNVIVILAIAGWPSYARVLRSEVLRLRSQDFVTQSKAMGGGSRWVILRHVLPNIVPTLLVLASLQMGVAIIAEGSLSFLGIGVPPPAPSWGGMLADGRSNITQAWWLATIPGVALSLTVLAANMMGDWLRVHNDPTTRK